MTSLTPRQHQDYERDGFLILRSVIPQALIQELVDAIERLRRRALAGEIELPFIDRAQGVLARQSRCLGPDKYDDAFGRLFEEYLVDTLESFSDRGLRHSLFGLLAGGAGKAYLLHWHRDLTEPGDPTMPAALMPHWPQLLVQFNLPLKPGDRFLQVIPGSHARPSTDAESAAWTNDPTGDMPGMITVALEPGDVAYYNPLIWHRGHNPTGAFRWTLHAAFLFADAPIMAHERGQADALRSPAHLERLPARLRAYVQRYIARHDAAEATDTFPTLYEVFRAEQARIAR